MESKEGQCPGGWTRHMEGSDQAESTRRQEEGVQAGATASKGKRQDTRHQAEAMCTALLARMGAQLSTPHSPGRGRLQSGRHLLETLPACRAGRERGAGTTRACLPMGHPCFQEPGQGAAPLPETPSRGLLFKPLLPSLGASNAGMPLAIHSPEQGGRAKETPSLARGGRS